MDIINSVWATIRFELSRVLTVQRFSVALIMALFPPTMIFILAQSGALLAPEFMIALFCGMICLLSLLLWSTSNVYTELEGKSWTFVTTRPYGRWSILFGKFLIGFGLSFVISWVALTLSIWVAAAESEFLTEAIHIGPQTSTAFEPSDALIMDGLGSMENRPESEETPNGNMAPGDMTVKEEYRSSYQERLGNENVPHNTRFDIWLCLSAMLFLGSMVYSAIFSLLGVIIQRKAMVFAVVYFGVVELALAALPAIIGKIAMSFHLFCLMYQWLGWIIPDVDAKSEFDATYGIQEQPFLHLAAVFGMTFFCLAVAAVIVRMREYITLEDSQV